MEHPLTANRISGLVYWLFPLAIGVTQAVFNSYYQILPLNFALTDGLTFGLVLGILGVAIWYVVRYNDPEKSAVIQILVSHLAAALVFTSLWLLASGIIVKILINNTLYDHYLYSKIAERSIAGIIFYTLLVSVYYIYVYSQHNREKQLREAEWQNQIRKAQLSALKSQINPHFLFNSLNSVASLTLSNPEKAHEMVIALSEFMRYSLRSPKDDMVTLEVELRNIGLYLQIEKIRFGSNLQYRFDVDEECNHHPIPNLILQPVFENAIKYGIYESSSPLDIILEARKFHGRMQIKVINDFDPESFPIKGEGVGLANINDRLRLLYGSSRLLTIERGETRFSVAMDIPDITDIIH
jgi:two-component system LytT family sensor kinase